MTIIVDSREPWNQVFERLSDQGVDHQLEALNGPEHPFADYLVANRTCAIQRKTVNDFVGSIDSLKEELFQLREAHEYSMLLIEGSWRVAGDRIALKRGKSLKQTITVSSWHNFMVSQQLRGTAVMYTQSLRETCRVLESLDEYMVGDRGPPVDTVEEPSMLLQLLPGVGPKTAERVIDTFGSTYLALVNIGRWEEEVHGVGEKTQERVVKWFDD